MLDTPTKIRCCNVDLESLEFDGETVLCRVCGDKASGFHYGVHACEGCKGFFRRSIQQKIQYRPCLKNQECTISRVNRNRCQYCRLKKCIAVGMSRDAVRFGRVPKKEKAKILEQMQKVNLNSQTNYLTAILQNDNHVISQTIKAHAQTCEFTREKFERFQKRAWQKPEFVACSSNRACPLNPNVLSEKKWSELSDSFTPAVQSVVDFAKSIPGFTVLTQEDQMTLLKAGTFEVLLLRLACLFDCQTNTMMFVDGKLYKRNNSQEDSTGGFLQESMFEFAERLADLKLTDDEMGLFSAIVVIATNRPGLRNPEHVECIQSKLTHGLQNLLLENHPDDPALFGKLLMKIPDLRTLNTLHSEKLFGMSQSLKKSPPEVPETPGPPAPVEPICPMSARRTSAPEASYPSYPNIIPNLKHQVSALPNYQSQLDMVRKIKAEMSTQPSSSHSDSNIVRSNTWSYSPQQKDYSMLKKRHSQVHADEFLQASMVSHLNDKILSDKFQTVRGMLNDRPDLMYAPYYPYMYSKEMMYSYYPYGFAPPVTKQELKFDLELASRLHKEKEYRDRSPCDSPRLRLNSTGGNSSKTESSSPSSSPKCWNEQRETKSPLERTHSPRSLAQSPYSMYPPHMQKGSQEKTHDRETLFRSVQMGSEPLNLCVQSTG